MGKTLPMFKLGLGGPIGRGRSWWPWITLEDEFRAITFLLDHDVRGAVNLVAPKPVRNAEYTAALGQALHRPALLPVPLLAPSLLLGRELAEALLGQSQRVIPERLTHAGFEFRHPEIGPALRSQF
jgi:NAD dependent epimerase/dehydratase family enzyme